MSMYVPTAPGGYGDQFSSRNNSTTQPGYQSSGGFAPPAGQQYSPPPSQLPPGGVGPTAPQNPYSYSPDPNAGISSMLNQLIAGENAAGQVQIGDIQKQLALQPSIYNTQAQQLGQNYGYQQQQFGVQQQQLGIQGTSLDQQLANLQAQYGIQQTGFQEAGQNLEAQYGYQQQQFGLQGQEIQSGFQNSLQDLLRGSAASGAFGSVGRYTGQQRLETSRNQQQQQLGISEGQAAQAHKYGEETLSNQEASAAQSNKYGNQQIQDAKQQLQLSYKSLGISEEQAKSQYQNALNTLGLQNALTVDQLETEIAKVQAGMYTPITNILGQLISAGAPVTI